MLSVGLGSTSGLTPVPARCIGPGFLGRLVHWNQVSQNAGSPDPLQWFAGRQLRVNPVLRETFDEIIHEIEDIIQKFTATPSLDLDHLMSYYAQLQQEQQILMKAIQDNDPKEFQGIAESQATMMGVIQVVNDPKTQRGFQVMMIQLAIEIEKILDKIHWDDLQALGADDVNHQHDFQTFGV